MTEAHWNELAFPIPLLNFLRLDRRLMPRKSRLFACGCARLVWPNLAEAEIRFTVETAERFIENQESAIGLEIAHRIARDTYDNNPGDRVLEFGFHISEATINETLIASITFELLLTMSEAPRDLGIATVNRRLASLVREVFPHSDRPFELSWRTVAVHDLASGMYESRDFSAMPILADALEEAGCHNAAVLRHCRDSNHEHIRGCWVLDLILGKE